jgi:hypothetical protein
LAQPAGPVEPLPGFRAPATLGAPAEARYAGGKVSAKSMQKHVLGGVSMVNVLVQ